MEAIYGPMAKIKVDGLRGPILGDHRWHDSTL